MGDRVVCFDLGGVVIRICRSWQEGCEAAGLDVREPERFADPALRARRRELTDLYQAGEITCDAYWREVSSATGGIYSPDEIERIHRAWTIDDYPGVREVIEQLNALGGVVTACLSNTNHAHWEMLRTGGESPSAAIGAIARPFVSHEMGAVKPSARIYRLFEEGIGASPEQVLFFDDLAPNIEAARACGWDAEQVDFAGDTAAQIASALRSRRILN
jgi:putative hydrolase of the HAD superfamily